MLVIRGGKRRTRQRLGDSRDKKEGREREERERRGRGDGEESINEEDEGTRAASPHLCRNWEASLIANAPAG